MAPWEELSLSFSWKSSIIKPQSSRRFRGFCADARSAAGSTKRSCRRTATRTPARVKSPEHREALRSRAVWMEPETSYLAASARQEAEESTSPRTACLREAVGDPRHFSGHFFRSYLCATRGDRNQEMARIPSRCRSPLLP